MPASEPPASGPRWGSRGGGRPRPGEWASPGEPQKMRPGRGCLWGCAGALAAVVIIVAVVVVIGLGGTFKDPKNPPSADVKVTSCTVDPATRFPSAGLEIHNRSSKASTYSVSVEFITPTGTRVAEGAALSLTVASGQRVKTSALGLNQVTQKVMCKVTKVNRFVG